MKKKIWARAFLIASMVAVTGAGVYGCKAGPAKQEADQKDSQKANGKNGEKDGLTTFTFSKSSFPSVTLPAGQTPGKRNAEAFAGLVQKGPD